MREKIALKRVEIPADGKWKSVVESKMQNTE
jgi:hypothetical protein